MAVKAGCRKRSFASLPGFGLSVEGCLVWEIKGHARRTWAWLDAGQKNRGKWSALLPRRTPARSCTLYAG